MSLLPIGLSGLVGSRYILALGGFTGLTGILAACGSDSTPRRTSGGTAHAGETPYEREVRHYQENCSHLSLSSIYPEDVEHVRSYDCSGVISEYLYVPETTSDVAYFNDSGQCNIARMWNLDNYYKCAPCTQWLQIDAYDSYINDSVIQGGLYCEATAPTDDYGGYYVNYKGYSLPNPP